MNSLMRLTFLCIKVNNTMKKTFFLFFAMNRENRMWSFTIIGLVALSLTMQSFISAPQEDGDGELSPLVGCWNYIWNDDVHQFYI